MEHAFLRCATKREITLRIAFSRLLIYVDEKKWTYLLKRFSDIRKANGRLVSITFALTKQLVGDLKELSDLFS